MRSISAVVVTRLAARVEHPAVLESARECTSARVGAAKLVGEIDHTPNTVIVMLEYLVTGGG